MAIKPSSSSFSSKNHTPCNLQMPDESNHSIFDDFYRFWDPNETNEDSGLKFRTQDDTQTSNGERLSKNKRKRTPQDDLSKEYETNEASCLTYRVLDDTEAPNFEKSNTYDVLFIESIHEVFLKHVYLRQKKDLTNLLLNIQNRIIDYSDANKKIYFFGTKVSNLKKIKRFCKNRPKLKKLFEFLNNYFEIEKIIPPKKLDLINVEIGGFYGDASVWSTARRAAIVVAKILPYPGTVHPNSRIFDIRDSSELFMQKCMINPNITQGHQDLPEPGKTVFNSFIEFPKINKLPQDLNKFIKNEKEAITNITNSILSKRK